MNLVEAIAEEVLKKGSTSSSGVILVIDKLNLLNAIQKGFEVYTLEERKKEESLKGKKELKQ